MEPEFSRQILEKYSDINFHENPSTGRPVVRTYVQTDVTDLSVVFRKFAKAPDLCTISTQETAHQHITRVTADFLCTLVLKKYMHSG